MTLTGNVGAIDMLFILATNEEKVEVLFSHLGLTLFMSVVYIPTDLNFKLNSVLAVTVEAGQNQKALVVVFGL